MKRIVGVVLLIAGIAGAIFGYYQYTQVQSSLGNAISKIITGRSQEEQQAVLIMIGSLAGALVGLFLCILPGRPKGR
ncbi:DUF3185 family protein [Treponema sp. J25]|uniref:DUF3185 family protein n=1 Tax=Treponema sp. J25 TaxID=2094121 RepID=UPI001042F041|nr:DUF3185 family protein [Treponema sp. J25]TCW60406.1 hypothetical protein C5O22_11550 [Treponema sp. J25]